MGLWEPTALGSLDNAWTSHTWKLSTAPCFECFERSRTAERLADVIVRAHPWREERTIGPSRRVCPMFGSVMVIIRHCHCRDPGSIPGQSVFLFPANGQSSAPTGPSPGGGSRISHQPRGQAERRRLIQPPPGKLSLGATIPAPGSMPAASMPGINKTFPPGFSGSGVAFLVGSGFTHDRRRVAVVATGPCH